MTEFGQLLFETARACQGRSAVTLAEVLRVKVRAWADDQRASELEHLGNPVIPPAEPFLQSSERSAA